MGFVRWRRAVPVASRPETLVQERPRSQAGREEGNPVYRLAAETRQPGKYKGIWDGKDNNGKQLGGGEYTVCIDAAREHGTYQSDRKQVILADKPFTEELEGNVEIKSASIEYRRKSSPK